MLIQWNKYSKDRNGFTLLELLAVLAIIATLSLFALPAFQSWNAKRSFDKTLNDFYSFISEARLESFSRATTVKIVTGGSADTYTISSFYNSSDTSLCSNSSGWTQIKTYTTTVNSNFQITGSGIGNICFYRDGSSTSGTYNIEQKNGLNDLGSGAINVIVTTGFIDVTKN